MRHQGQDATHAPPRDAAPVDLLDRVLGGGVVVSSEFTLAVADVDLMRVRLTDLLRAVSVAERGGYS